MMHSMIDTIRSNPFGSPFQKAYCESPKPPCKKPEADGAAGADGAETPPPQPEYSCEHGSLKYFLLCGLGGIVACGSTHTLMTPIDLIKCRLQVNHAKYKSLVHGYKVTVAEDGTRGLVRGWAPTLIGYSMQGMFKFGLYEYFKELYSKLLGKENSYTYRTPMYLCAAASAEFFADIALSPMEVSKVQIQTKPGFANTLRCAIPRIYEEAGLYGFYRSLVPLWMRQIPYTMMKFASFEKTIELLYKYVVPKPRAECSKAEQLGVTFAAGYIAGVFCAVVSHPADTVVSKMNEHRGTTAVGVFKKLGVFGIWKGLIPRIFMIGTLTALQWLVYDAFKVAMRMPRPPPPEMPPETKTESVPETKTDPKK